MISLIDTHTHLFCEEFDEDRELAILRAVEAGVTRMFMPNIDDTTIESLMSLCDKHANCYPLMGFHPTSVDADWEKRLSVVEKTLRSGYKFYGIGEVGMDLYWDKTYIKEQMKVFDIQTQWAIEFNLPLIIHCREAYPEMLEVLSKYKGTSLRGIFHSFGGTVDEAQALMEYPNFMLGINGVVTFKKSTLPDVLREVPIEKIVLETDSPYLAPVPYRGRRNESAYLLSTANKLSEIYGLPIDEISAQTTTNALKVFENVG
ncbi:MAG: TatD family hydrolase [Phocaeicola sp.]|nr:TatD family hydrolase [Phocaeicola sp.]